MDNDQDWVRVATHGDSAEQVRQRLVDALEESLLTLAEDLAGDPRIPAELVGMALARVRALYMARIERDVPLMLESMRLTAPAADDDQVH